MVIICLHEPHNGVMQESPSFIDDAKSAGLVMKLSLPVVYCDGSDIFPPVSTSFLMGCNLEFVPGRVQASLVRSHLPTWSFDSLKLRW